MPGRRFAFGPFVLDPEAGALSRNGAPIPIPYRASLLLTAFLNRPGEVLTKSDLIETAWQGAAVEEGNLAVQIAALRKLLGQSPEGGEWIATVPRVGYRFVELRAKEPMESIAWADTTTPHGRLMLVILGGLAEFERELIRARTGEGRRRAKARGVHLGRPPALNAYQRQEALARREAGESLTDIARTYGVSHTTISRLRQAPLIPSTT